MQFWKSWQEINKTLTAYLCVLLRMKCEYTSYISRWHARKVHWVYFTTGPCRFGTAALPKDDVATILFTK